MDSPELEDLMMMLARLPGLGPRSARRAALHLLNHKATLMMPLAASLTTTAEKIVPCTTCGNLDTSDPCHICSDGARDQSIICVIEEVGDLWAIERTNTFHGVYHVLGGTLSALDGIGPDQLRIHELMMRMRKTAAGEIILATNATVEGQTTAHYITEKLAPFNLTITRLAHGVPMGGELDYLDDGTLTAALTARRPF